MMLAWLSQLWGQVSAFSAAVTKWLRWLQKQHRHR
jgi:hypothetical protein